MKKISGLIALLMCVIIGGVYANWAYSKSEDIQDEFVELSLGLAGASQEGSDGHYTIETNASFKIYQKEGTNHMAEMRVETSDGSDAYLTVKFTPTSSASIAVKENGIPTEIAFTTSSPFTYKIDADGNYDSTIADEDATAVLEFANEANGAFQPNVTWQKKWVNDIENGTVEYFYVTFDADELLQQVNLVELSENKTFVLDTYVEYAAFRDATLHAGSIIVKVTDGHNVL